MKNFIITSSLLAASLVGTQAAIVVENTAFTTENNGSGDLTTTLSAFNMGSGTKLVVTVGLETGSGGTSNDFASITYGSQTLTQIANLADGAQRVGIFYLDAPTASSAQLQVTTTSNTALGFSAISISGAQAGFTDFSQALGTSSGSLNTAGNDALVIGAFATNAAGSRISPEGTVTYAANIGGGAGGESAGAYKFVATPGSTTYTFTGGSTSRPVATAASFEAIPEPSSTALLGLGGLALILRRRK